MHSLFGCGDRWIKVMLGFVVTLAVVAGGVQPPVAYGREEARILFIGSENSSQFRALGELGYSADRVASRVDELEQVNFFSYSTFVLESMTNRNFLSTETIRTPLFQAIERGAVLIAFRSYGGGLEPVQDEWLPVPATKDGAYFVEEILEPDHPMFTTPHQMTVDMLQRVHSGVMYHPYVELGEGWIPLAGGTELMRFFRNETGVPPYDGEPHYGIMELPYGQGRIVLVQMIPENQWLNTDGGRSDSVGRLLFENIITYGIESSRVIVQGEPEVPAQYVDGALGTLLNWVNRPSSPQMSLDLWEQSSEGPFTFRWDDRDIVTIRHPEVPSVEGTYATLSRTFAVGNTDGSTILTWYLTDDYLGGVDRFFEHDREVGRVDNWKEGYRFVEVAIDGEKVWEEDVLGANPFPWPHRLRTLDITSLVEGKDSVEVSISVVNRKGTDDPFWTDVWVSRVALLDGVPARWGAGEIQVHTSGAYVPVIQVLDAPGERGTLTLRAAGETHFEVSLTADDLRDHWIVGELLHLESDESVVLDFSADPSGSGDEAVRVVYLLPEAYLAVPEPELADVRSWFIADEPVDRIALQVQGPEEVNMTGPVSHGIPFAEGGLMPEELDRLSLVDAEGQNVPLQTRSLAVWPDGSVKWALISFVGQPGGYELIIDRSAKTSAPSTGLIRQLDERRFEIDSGRLALELDVGDGLQIHGATVDGLPIDLHGMDFTLTYRNGTLLSLRDAQINEVQLLENGSERAVLWIRGNYVIGGRPDLEFTLQWRVYRNQPFAWVDAAFTNRLGRRVELSDIRFHVDGNFGHALGIPNDAGNRLRSVPLENSWAVVQPDELLYSELVNGEKVGGDRRFPGWITLESKSTPTFFAGVRHFWEQYPKALQVTSNGLEFGLWAEETGQILEVADGFQKTHELLLGWIDPDEAVSTGQLLYQPYVLTFDPDYLIGTGALGILGAPPRIEGYPVFRATYEESVNETYTRYINKRENRREYGMQNFGDDTFEWGFGPSYTFWSNQEYDHHYGFLIQHLRAGDLRYWQLGDQAARHYRDVDVIHHSTNPILIGAPRAHNTKHVVTEGWYPDHNLGGVSVHHAWVEGLWLHYLLTGDELTYRAAKGASDWFASQVENDRWFRGGVERGPGWALIALMGSYRATSDERYLQAAQIIADDVYLRQDPIRGVYSVPVDGRPSYEGGQSFMSGILTRGMARFYVETGDPRAARSVARFYDWLMREMRVDATRFIYKQAPGWHNPGNSDQVVSALAYGLALLDRPEDWEMTITAANIQANVRSMSWMPEALAIFERLYGKYVPLEIISLGSSRAEIGREGPIDVELSLARLGTDQFLEGVLEFTGLPEGMSVSRSHVPYRLEPGQSLYPFSVQLDIEPTVAPGRYFVTVSDPRHEELSHTFPVNVPARTTIDRFQPPIDNPWFAGFSLRVHEAQSDGWQHIKVGSADRLRRTGSTEEYLIYDAHGFFDLELTMYAPQANRDQALQLIQVAISEDEGATWTTLLTDARWENEGESDYVKVVITPQERYFRGDVKLKVTVLQGGEADWVQLDRLEITGWR